MNKKDFLKILSKNSNVTQSEAKNLFNAFWQSVQEALQQEEELVFTGWGRFYRKIVPSRKGRNPSTGEEMQVPAYTKVGFKAGRGFIDAVEKVKKG